MTKYIRDTPHAKQHAALLLSHVKEIFFGGAGGAGKSHWLLMEALQYVDVPGYNALLLRNTYGQLNMPNSILNRAHQWLRNSDARWYPKDMRYIFPKGSILQFGYCSTDADVYNYDGPEYQFIGWDELTSFTQHQYTHLFARLRKLKSAPVPLRVRSASNPGNHGHQWVKNRMILNQNSDRIFVPANLRDNSYLDAESYEKSLMELDPVTQAQRRDGDWDVIVAGLFFKPGWFKRYCKKNALPTDIVWVRFWDLAATEGAGDYTVGVKIGMSMSTGDVYIDDVIRVRSEPGAVEALVVSTAIRDTRSVRVRWEQEGGSAGKALSTRYKRILAGFDCDGRPSTASKVIRWKPLASQASSGNVVLVEGSWTEDFILELCTADGSDKMHDDQVDAASGGFTELTLEPVVYFGVSRV